MNTELITALDILEKEKKISKKVLIEAIENSLLAACKNHFGKNENFTAKVDPKTGDFKVTAAKEVVETVEDSVTQISLADAQMISPKYNIGDTINVEIKSAEFGRIAVQNSKSAILQKIREEERQAVYNEYHAKEKDIVTGIVSRYAGNNLVINLGRPSWNCHCISSNNRYALRVKNTNQTTELRYMLPKLRLRRKVLKLRFQDVILNL